MATILIVDDNPSQAQLMAGVVQSMGHHPIIVNDGESALATVKTSGANLVLMDVVMPGMNGFEACRKIRRDKETAHIPVVMVTTKDQETDKFWATKQGASGYITKPYTPEALAASIDAYL